VISKKSLTIKNSDKLDLRNSEGPRGGEKSGCGTGEKIGRLRQKRGLDKVLGQSQRTKRAQSAGQARKLSQMSTATQSEHHVTSSTATGQNSHHSQTRLGSTCMNEVGSRLGGKPASLLKRNVDAEI